MSRIVRTQISKASEKKHYITNSANNQLYHNTGADGNIVPHLTNLLSTFQGLTQTTRVGDKIFSERLDFKVWVSNKLDRPNVTYRIVVLKGDQYDCLATSSISALFFPINIGDPQYNITGHLNTDKFSILVDKIINPFGGDYSVESGATLREHSRMITFSVPTNKSILYRSDNGQIPEGKNVYQCIVMAFDAHGTLASNDLATVNVNCIHHYRDS